MLSPAAIAAIALGAVIIGLLAHLLSAEPKRATAPTSPPAQPAKPRRYQKRAASLAAHEVLPTLHARLTRDEIDAAIIRTSRRLSKRRRDDRFNSMIATGMIRANGDGTYSRTLEAE